MEWFTDILQNPYFIGAVIGLNIILCVLYCMNVSKLNKLRRAYSSFMKRLGNGNNLEEMMKQYIRKVEDVERENKELKKYCQEIEQNAKTHIQKVGMVRYNAFKDTGSELSFTVALLDDNDTGVVLNGIYSFESSNIYAKPIKKGQSTYVLSEEEKMAIDKAMHYTLI